MSRNKRRWLSTPQVGETDNEHARLSGQRAPMERPESLPLAAFNYDPTIAYSEYPLIAIGLLEKTCPFCEVKKFRIEAPRMCCKGGEVRSPDFEAQPSELKRLMTPDSALSRYVGAQRCAKMSRGTR